MAAVTLTFKIKKKKKNQSDKCSLLPTYQVSLKYLQPFLRNGSVMHARTYTSENNKLSLLRWTT
jgi:hypothetical protein